MGKSHKDDAEGNASTAEATNARWWRLAYFDVRSGGDHQWKAIDQDIRRPQRCWSLNPESLAAKGWDGSPTRSFRTWRHLQREALEASSVPGRHILEEMDKGVLSVTATETQVDRAWNHYSPHHETLPSGGCWRHGLIVWKFIWEHCWTLVVWTLIFQSWPRLGSLGKQLPVYAVLGPGMLRPICVFYFIFLFLPCLVIGRVWRDCEALSISWLFRTCGFALSLSVNFNTFMSIISFLSFLLCFHVVIKYLLFVLGTGPSVGSTYIKEFRRWRFSVCDVPEAAFLCAHVGQPQPSWH